MPSFTLDKTNTTHGFFHNYEYNIDLGSDGSLFYAMYKHDFNLELKLSYKTYDLIENDIAAQVARLHLNASEEYVYIFYPSGTLFDFMEDGVCLSCLINHGQNSELAILESPKNFDQYERIMHSCNYYPNNHISGISLTNMYDKTTIMLHDYDGSRNKQYPANIISWFNFINNNIASIYHVNQKHEVMSIIP